YEIDPLKIVGLTIEAGRLAEIRQQRVRRLGGNNRQYAKLVEIYDELEAAEAVHRRLGCPVIEISDLSIEETAARVIRLIEPRRAPTRLGPLGGGRLGAGDDGHDPEPPAERRWRRGCRRANRE